MTPTRLFDFIEYQNINAPLEKAFTTKYNGVWESLNTQQFCDQAHQISRALLNLGINAQDKIAMISSTNRTEWNLIDTGLLAIGAVNVPIYPTITGPEYEYVLTHSESRFCFNSDAEIFEKLTKVAKNTMLEGIYSFEEVKGCDSWNMLFENDDPSLQDKVEEAKKLLNLCIEHNTLFIVNDDVNLCENIGAHGIHLGQNDMDAKSARERLGNHFIIGVTCHNSLELAIKAEQNGADYVALGAIFKSSTKPNATHCPLTKVEEIKKIVSIPIVGIGGINLTNQHVVYQSGCSSVAMIEGLFMD